MKKNFLYNTLLATSLFGLMACSGDADNSTFSVGDADNEIRFATGVVSANTSRAVYNTGNYKFLPLTAGTKLHIKTEGVWNGTVSHYTQTGTAAAPVPETSVSGITGVGIYWDDYGTADPANSANRAAGINVYAACIDGKEASSIGTISNWESLSWTLPADMATWKDKDLLFSNNNSDEGKTNSTNINKANVGRYKFDTQNAGTACNLEFHHAMSKITINLKAGKGFPVEGGVAKFASAPSVTLSSVKLSGTVNLKTLVATATGDATTATLTKTLTPTSGYTATYEGLVFPSSSFSAATDKVATINCDGNIYNIYAEKLMAAMDAAESSTTDHAFHSGKNYVLNIIVDKTEIKVTATVVNWVDVTADTIEPKIEVTTTLGDKGAEGSGFTSFDFYMSDDNGTTYSKYGGTATGTKADGTTAWTFSTPIYWPSHDTHYHMRGVYPTSTTVTNGTISVSNSVFNASAAPSNMMIGAPELAANTMCNNPEHTAVDMSVKGICAREATINLNFRYMMSQVEVRLTTPGTGSDNVQLANAVVEVLKGNTAGIIDIHNRTMTTNMNADYTIAHADGEDANYRHAAIVPQDLTNSSGDLQFRITITNSDSTKDYYYATIKDVLVSEAGGTATSITSWEPGKHYIYTLDMRKTQIKVTATIKDWVTATGSTSIWM